MGHKGYKNYDDWYDNGPGSEAFKRKMRTGRTQCLVPNFVQTEHIKVFREEMYCSEPLVERADMIRITLTLPIIQWDKIKQKVIRILALVRIGG